MTWSNTIPHKISTTMHTHGDGEEKENRICVYPCKRELDNTTTEPLCIITRDDGSIGAFPSFQAASRYVLKDIPTNT